MGENSPELEGMLQGVLETQERIAATLEKLNAAPAVATPATQGVEDQGTSQPSTRKWITPEERMDLGKTLRDKSMGDLHSLFSLQARKKDVGIPLDVWLNTAGFAAQTAFNGLHGQVSPEIAKAVDTSAVSALIRQDLEPILYEIFVRQFPAYDRFPKEPANGLVHAWNQITAYGDAKFMAELGTVTDDQATYARKTTNVAILATRRGVSLKSQFAVIAGGMAYNPEQIELNEGLRAMVHRLQKTIFEGQATNSGGLASNELGLYDANAFDGLRDVLNTGRAVDVDPATNPTTTGDMRRAIDAAVFQQVQQGAPAPSIVWMNPAEKITFDEQLDDRARFVAPTFVNIGAGVVAQQVNTIVGPLPFAIVTGDAISSYTASATLRRDIYMLDEQTISLPYLGAPGPTVLEIPIGISGQLTHLFIIFLMNGLAVKAIPFSNKIRVKVSA